jgi:adenosylmethionine-8-amino-7-oxononanoate aminotransferase
MGAVAAPPGYFQRIREICDHYDVLLIADEVMSGFGRTGRWFAIEHWNVVPDVLVAAKGVSGGYAPLAVLIAHERVVNALRDVGTPWVMGHTYAQNPVTAAAGLAVLDYIQRHDLVQAAEERGAQLRSGLQALIGRHRILGDARGLGLLLGVELVRDRATREPFPVEQGIAFRFARACIDEGAAVYPGQSGADGLVGDHALVTPPLVISREQVDDLVAAIDRGLTRLEAELSVSA